MDQMNEKQRKIIRLAFKSKDPDLRRRAVERVMTARYTPEFKGWANNQGSVFTHPKTKNQVRFNSLPSQSQKEVYRRWRAGDYEDKGGPAPGAHDDGDGGGKPPADSAAGEGGKDKGGERGRKHRDRTELRGEGHKALEDDALLKDRDLERMLPMDRIRSFTDKDFKGGGDRIINGLKDCDYRCLESLQVSTEYLAQFPDDEFSKKHWLVRHAKLDPSELKTFHKVLKKKMDDVNGRKYSKDVLEIANDNDLEGVDADAVWQFRKDKPAWGRKLSPEELKQKFLQGNWADAETKERVRQMSADEFMAMRNAIFDEDEEEGLTFSEPPPRTASTEELRLFERPPTRQATEVKPEAKKEAKLSDLGRRIVRMAYHSTDAEVRKKLVRRARAELS